MDKLAGTLEVMSRWAVKTDVLWCLNEEELEVFGQQCLSRLA